MAKIAIKTAFIMVQLKLKCQSFYSDSRKVIRFVLMENYTNKLMADLWMLGALSLLAFVMINYVVDRAVSQFVSAIPATHINTTRIATASNYCKGYRAWVSGPLLPITF